KAAHHRCGGQPRKTDRDHREVIIRTVDDDPRQLPQPRDNAGPQPGSHAALCSTRIGCSRSKIASASNPPSAISADRRERNRIRRGLQSAAVDTLLRNAEEDAGRYLSLMTLDGACRPSSAFFQSLAA